MIARRLFLAAPAALALPVVASRPALAAPAVGAAAPAFSATDSNGKPVSLAQFAGKPVVLEWTNDGCPYVRKWYGANAMQDLQRQAAAMGAVWLSVISSPPGEQGFAEGPRANELTNARNAAPAHVLLDPDQKLARLYGATVTPTIFIIDGKGTLVYSGGADSIASARPDDLPKATPYVKLALAAMAAGQPIPHSVTRPYGCVVKYRTQA